MAEPLGIYVSVPFCQGKCTFCNFASDVFAPGLMPQYIVQVVREIAGARERARRMGAELPERVDTVYLGGGTPSLLDPEAVRTLFGALRGEFRIEAGAEITVECAPGQLTDGTLRAFQGEGVNRISLGVQSFVDAEAAAVGRRHTGAMCRAEVERLRAAGIDDLGVDLIAGLPGQTTESWERSLAEVEESGVGHASVYLLELDEDSRLGREAIAGGGRYGASTLPVEEETVAMYEGACTRMETAGLRQYEISNFARAGRQSRHNGKYWRRAPYLGFGLDAHSMLRAADGDGELRFANTGEMADFLAETAGGLRLWRDGDEDLRPRRVGGRVALEESLFLGLRMNSGVSVDDLRGTPEDLAAIWTALEEARRDGLVQVEAGRAMLTARGRLLSNEVFARLLLTEAA